ncbi:MAG: alpha-glucuronidase family glycosyl hydrolase [Thermomicrobiales bacterium]
MRLDRRVLIEAALAAGLCRALPEWSGPASAHAAIDSTADDGYELWLRYRPVDDADLLEQYRAAMVACVNHAAMPIASSIASELERACRGMLGTAPQPAEAVERDGTILIGTPDRIRDVLDRIGETRVSSLGAEGYLLRTAKVDGHTITIVAATSDRGLLYGMFGLIQLMQMRASIAQIEVVDVPRANLRMMNHWDDLDRTIERGYAGLSIFQFGDLTTTNPRYEDYARMLASVGINGTVINDVNASPAFLDSAMMPGYRAIAEIFRRWGITLYLSANFASPIDLTHGTKSPLVTADPLDPNVAAWWQAKADELYTAVPDFGGFLVKANSEGEPGPLSYKRTHADGANMLAKAVGRHGGIVIWRSFVHRGFQTWSEFEFRTFEPLDGEFADNVVLQTKNGPIDFLMREPVNPLFGAMPRTNQMIELQITQEYTGHATHLCFLPAYWQTVLDFETHYDGDGPTVAQIIDGTADDQPLTGFAGVINVGDDRNWTGSFLAAANTYGFARLAWDHGLAVDQIAREWVTRTFGPDPEVVDALAEMLDRSWEVYESYTSPFGVGYLMRPDGAHFSPDPQGTQHLSHITDSHGSGYDRTLATGTGYTRFYSDYWFDRYEHLDSCPEALLMFMHIVPWDHRLANGKTAIQQIYDRHFAGVEAVESMQRSWDALRGRIDANRHEAIAQQFDRQLLQSKIWRDVLLSYYFDHARLVSTSRPWIQLETGVYPTLVQGGRPNQLPLRLTNATEAALGVRLFLDAAMTGWSGTRVEETIPSRGTAEAIIIITPPIEPYLGPVRFSLEPAAVQGLGIETQMLISTPNAAACTFAFDVGSAPNAVVPGYRALTAGSLWRSGVDFGWVGASPTDDHATGNWDTLQNDFATDRVRRRMRLRIPGGSQRAWVLIGGQGTGTQPVRVSEGAKTLVDSGYLEESAFQWFGFTLDGGKTGREVDLDIAGADGRVWRLAALVLLKPGT